MSALYSQAVAELLPELIETRHHLHANPELSHREEQTSAYVAERLRSLGLSVRTGVGGHGVVADVVGALPGKTFAIRADMDALPILEASDLPYKSNNPGVMHACGHDGHTTTLLGTARALVNRRDEISGTVRLIFQPAEETVGGALKMCEQGAMDGVDAIVALHGWPGVGVGQIGIRPGPMMASADTFEIQIFGGQAHAAYPHLSVDPIVIGAQIVLALQTISSREVDPNCPVVVTVGIFQAGTAHNIIPGTARLRGTYRTLAQDVRDRIPEQIQRIAEGVCSAGRARCEIEFVEGTGPVVNDPAVTQLIQKVGADFLGAENVQYVPHSSMGAEDFAAYLDYAPGAMFRLGLGHDVTPLHTPTFNFTDAALPIGVEMFVRIAMEYLSAGA